MAVGMLQGEISIIADARQCRLLFPAPYQSQYIAAAFQADQAGPPNLLASHLWDAASTPTSRGGSFGFPQPASQGANGVRGGFG